jgi:hypothetical protein
MQNSKCGNVYFCSNSTCDYSRLLKSNFTVVAGNLAVRVFHRALQF